jgi:Family of unknown function (DUF5995)
MLDYGLELAGARSTLNLSSRVASSFIRQLGALAPILIPPFPQAHIGRHPGFQVTVMDDKYWFAKLYELITYFEIRDHGKFDQPGFVLHFIPVFYKLYYDALQGFQAHSLGSVSPLWLTHFNGLRKGAQPVEPGSLDGVKHSIRTGVTAHVQGDMANALENAYRTWRVKAKPPFQDLKKDFFERNLPTFQASKAAFFLDLNDKGPFPFRPDVGQLIIAEGEQVSGGGLSVTEVYKWREAAWKTAASRLVSAAAAGRP